MSDIYFLLDNLGSSRQRGTTRTGNLVPRKLNLHSSSLVPADPISHFDGTPNLTSKELNDTIDSTNDEDRYRNKDKQNLKTEETLLYILKALARIAEQQTQFSSELISIKQSLQYIGNVATEEVTVIPELSIKDREALKLFEIKLRDEVVYNNLVRPCVGSCKQGTCKLDRHERNFPRVTLKY